MPKDSRRFSPSILEHGHDPELVHAPFLTKEYRVFRHKALKLAAADNIACYRSRTEDQLFRDARSMMRGGGTGEITRYLIRRETRREAWHWASDVTSAFPAKLREPLVDLGGRPN